MNYDFYQIPSVLLDGSTKYIDKKTKKEKVLSAEAEIALLYTSSLIVRTGELEQGITVKEWMKIRGISDYKVASKELKKCLEELMNTCIIGDGKEINIIDNITFEDM